MTRNAVVPLDRWCHVAGVFGRTETRLYVGGKLVGTGPATRPEGGTTFVVGNVGRDYGPLFGQAREGDYVAILSYLPGTAAWFSSGGGGSKLKTWTAPAW